LIVSLGLGFMTFDSFDAPSQSEVHDASAAVVFTGSFARLDEGLRLVNSGAVPRLYISGFNAEAGLLPSNFLDQFSQRNPSIANLQLLVECCVEWGVRAANTLQNAQDTRCWIERRGLTGALLLITSRQHMARAMVALSAALPSHVIVPYPADDEISPTDRLRGRALEYVKYLTTFFAVHWPGSFQGRYGPFAQFCMRGIDETDARKNRGEPKPAGFSRSF
jgi:uncharacterized SAM-binding protein YcdF (DUF218 family)